MGDHSPVTETRAPDVGDRSMKDWPQITKELTAQLRNLRGGAPEVMQAFSGIAQAATAAKALVWCLVNKIADSRV